MVGGPQIGYFYPGLTYEIDMHAPGLQWRGATSAPFPGYMLIGRGEDFATTLTSAERRHHRPVRGDALRRQRHEVPVQGPVPAAWAPSTPARSNGEPVTFRTTVHGPVVGYATVNGKKVAISSKRSSYGKDVARPALQPPALDRPGPRPEVVLQGGGADPADVQLLLHRQQAHRRVHEPACCRSGRKNVDPGLPTKGTGKYEWTGLPRRRRAHPHGIDPERRDDDQLEPTSPPTASAPPTTSGAATARSSASTC